MNIRPDAAAIERAARLLVEARNPLISVGDEITLCKAGKAVVELAELLGAPVAGQGEFGVWSKPFPTRHPLYIGPRLRTMRFPGDVDVHLNIGNHYSELAGRGAKLISIRLDAMSLARSEPVDLPIVADIRLGVEDLVAAIKAMVPAARLRPVAESRANRVHAWTRDMARMREQIVAAAGNGPAIRREHLAVALERALPRDTIYVTDCDSGKAMDPLMSFGGDDKAYICPGPAVLGWAAAASIGAKLAQPDRPVISIMGDGSAMFSGPQPFWSMARYKAPVTSIIYNNLSYNNERNRIWTYGAGTQFKRGLDMTCYNGNPDVDFAKAAQAYGVEGEVVRDNAQLAPALARALQANVRGEPYVLDIHVERDGIGAAVAWHPGFSIADKRTRKV
jgi:thiamine pyrophosphate-dependent acetolactate synthase large subunit-like protein